MSASSLLRTARHSQGASQRALARLAHVSQPGIAAIESGAHDTTVSRLEELLAALNHQIILVPTRTRPVWVAAADIRELLESGDSRTAWREVIQLSDDLVREPPPLRLALAITRPHTAEDVRYDALIAAVVDYRLSEDALPRPAWLDDPAFTLREPWDVEPLESLRHAARQQTPPAIARHGIFMAASELASV